MDMWVSTDNNISVKEYNKISKYKSPEKGTNTTTVPVIMGVLDMIKKGTNTLRYLAVPVYSKYKKKTSLYETAYLLGRVRSIWIKKYCLKEAVKSKYIECT